MQQLSRANNGSRAISKIVASEFPGHEYSHTHIQKYLNDPVHFFTNSLVGQVKTVQPIVHMPHLAGTGLPHSIISQYPGSSSDQSWSFDNGLEGVDNYSDTDWVNKMNDSTDEFQYVIPYSFTQPNPLIEDPSTMMVEAMKEVFSAIPRIGINSWMNRVLTDVWRKFNPESTPLQQGNVKSDEDKIKESLAKYEESEKRGQALKEQAKAKDQEERTKYHENMMKMLDVLRKKVEGFRESLQDKKVAPTTVQPDLPGKVKILDTTNALGSGGSPAGNPGKEFLQEKTSNSQEHNQTQDSNGVGVGVDAAPPGPGIVDKLKQPDQEKHFPGLAPKVSS